MKQFFTTALLFIFSTYGFAALEYKELLHIPWGKNTQQVSIRTAPGGQFGPAAFRVAENEISILDSENQRVLFYHSGKYNREVFFKLPFTDDFSVVSPNKLILLNENAVYESDGGKLEKIYSPPLPSYYYYRGK